MSDMSTPAGNPGGDPIAAALADLPARIRVHALAKLLDKSSREVLAAVAELGVDGRSVQSSIDRELALRVAQALGVVAAPEEPAQVAEPTSAQPAESGFRQGTNSPFSEPSTRPAPSGQAPAESSRVIPPTPVFASASPLFLPPEPTGAPPQRPARAKDKEEPEVVEEEEATDETDEAFGDDSDEGRPRRRRGRRGRGRGKGGQDEAGDEVAEDEPKATEKPEKPSRRAKPTKEEPAEAEDSDETEAADGDDPASRRRRRRRRRRGGDDGEAGATTDDDPPNTVVHVREAREAREVREEKPESDGRDEVRSVRGSTRLEAKRQRRRDGREAGRRRAPILSEAEFLARREAVDRAMVVREKADRIQIGVLEDGVLVEHFVTSAGTGSLVGNVYLGRVQNVLPSMEAAFVDIGRGRNAVLYAGEVDWDAAGLEGKARKIEQALSTGDSVLVQVTKDPVGHKGARLTTQISLPGRFLVYVPGGGATGISRKLPENERRRLKDVLKRVVPEDAGVIIRTASEGISEEELARDVRRLQAQWQVIKDKTEGTNGARKVGAPSLVYEEPDLLVKVVRDLFTEDFSALVVQGGIAWETVDAYVRHVAPELADRLRKHVGNTDVFAEYRIDEQLLKALDRKVWLPSGGYLVIDRTEAMTVIDVNTGKFTGSGGNLEETVTRNNLESAEEIVRQLRLRDIGGIIVIDFIDMVLESNRDLVLRRLTECLGRDRTRHQVAEVTSLGLVQMTRKRVGTGLLEAFGTTCEHCKGRGVLVTPEPVTKPNGSNGHTEPARGSTRRSRGGRADEPKDTKDKPQAKDAAKEAAAQAAKEAVRDIAKATTKTPDRPEDDTHTEPAPEPEEAPVQAETPPSPEEQPRGERRRTRTRAHRPATRNGTPLESSDATATPSHQDTHAHVNGSGDHSGSPAAASPSANGTHTGPDGTESAASTGSDTFADSAATRGGGGSDTVDATSASSASAGSASAGLTSAGSSSVDRASTGSAATDPTSVGSGLAGSGDGVGSDAFGSASDGPTGSDESNTFADSASGESASAGSDRFARSTSAGQTPAGSASSESTSAASGEDAGSGAVGGGSADYSVTGPPAADAPTHGSSSQGSSDYQSSVGASSFGTRSSERSSAETSAHGSSFAEGSDSDESEESVVPAPATPPRRQPRRAASRPAGPPVSAGHDG
ncbi:Rne/Rng family ribonuclease [Actinophytocola oryzae]|uniref:Ribonuclease E n=1 Tax=Actinophytocola oryzae TaxID=502181 RepID=A0A4R7UUD7_9PSEU|nr:translation initiation factor IF-2 N-terminal domain-containing protein [Actinophytocola oryzae]TDV38697.1 ribonuclease E [Actinophytocola oryzae]